MIQKIATYTFWILFLMGTLGLLGFVGKQSAEDVCLGFDVNIAHRNDNRFIDEQDVAKLLANLGYEVRGQRLRDIDLGQIEARLEQNPSVSNAEVYATIDCELKIEIAERMPIARIINSGGSGFYLDRTGNLMPLSSKYTARVMVVNGHVEIPYAAIQSGIESEYVLAKKQWLDDLYQLVSTIHGDPFWKAQIAQLYIDERQEIVLIPKVGNHRILFGDAKDIEPKLDKLMTLYKKGFSKTGWNDYKTINLKFQNQVVCSKK